MRKNIISITIISLLIGVLFSSITVNATWEMIDEYHNDPGEWYHDLLTFSPYDDVHEYGILRIFNQTGQSYFYRYNPYTNESTYINTHGLAAYSDVRWLDSDRCIFLQSYNVWPGQQSVLINITSNTMTYLPNLRGVGMDWDPVNGILWICSFNPSVNRGTVSTYDISTDTQTLHYTMGTTGSYIYNVKYHPLTQKIFCTIFSGFLVKNTTSDYGSGYSVLYDAIHTFDYRHMDIDPTNHHIIWAVGHGPYMMKWNATTETLEDSIDLSTFPGNTNQWLFIQFNRQGEFLLYNTGTPDGYLFRCTFFPTFTYEYLEADLWNYNWEGEAPLWVRTGHYLNDEYFFFTEGNFWRYSYDFPDLNITTTEGKTFNGVTPYVTGNATRRGTHTIQRIECIVDDSLLYIQTGSWSYVDWNISLPGLTEGSHTLNISSFDERNYNCTPRIVNITYNIRPWVTITSPLTFNISEGSTIQGAASSDTITVQISINNNATWIPASYSSGSWYYILPNGLTGTIRIYARSFDGSLYSPQVFRDYRVIPEDDETPPIGGNTTIIQGDSSEVTTAEDGLGDWAIAISALTLVGSFILVILSLAVVIARRRNKRR